MRAILFILNFIIFTKNFGQEVNYNKENFSYWKRNISYEFKNANAFEIDLEQIDILDVKGQFGPTWNVIFTPNSNRMIYVKGNGNNDVIIVKELPNFNTITTFEGSHLRAVSPDGNRIYFDNNIYDIKQRKNYPINADADNYYWNNGNIIWLDEDYIISYKNIQSKNGNYYPDNDYYYKLDLNDLQLKKMNSKEIELTFKRIQNLWANYDHPNFYLYFYSTTDIIIQDRKTPFSKSLLHTENGHPMNRYWFSPFLKYLVVSKWSKTYTNRDELVLYKLKYKENDIPLFFRAISPKQWLSEDFKKIYNKTDGVGIWAYTYEPKINPLNNKVVGYQGFNKSSVKIIKDLGNNEIGIMVGYFEKKIKSGDIISGFHLNYDRDGAWTTIIEPWNVLKKYFIDFTKLKPGVDSREVKLLHTILNLDKRTQVAKKGINSSGNEASLYLDETTKAVKKFQKLRNIQPTGIIDIKTSKELNKIYNVYMKQKKLNELFR